MKTETFDYRARIERRRSCGAPADAIAQYAHSLLTGVGDRHHFTAEDVLNVLTADEAEIYCRMRAAIWARLAAAEMKRRAERAAAEIGGAHHARHEAQLDLQRAAEAAERRRLQSAKALTSPAAAEWLGISTACFRKLVESGKLPADGSIPVQGSYGRPARHWLPSTLMRYKNRRPAE